MTEPLFYEFSVNLPVNSQHGWAADPPIFAEFEARPMEADSSIWNDMSINALSEFEGQLQEWR